MTEAERRAARAPEPEPQPVAEDATPTEPEAAKEKERSFWAKVAEFPLLVLFAFIIAVLIKTFLVQAFYIPSESMAPTLLVRDRVLVEKLSYRFGDPERRDVIVFARDVVGPAPDVPWPQDAQNFLRELLGLPTGAEQDYIKRIVGMGGDVISYRGDPRTLVVNGEVVDEPYVFGGNDRTSTPITRRDCRRMELIPDEGGCRVPEGTVFVMGDNRASSEDSRIFGPIAEDKIVGRAFVILWPIGRFQGL